MAGKTAVTDYCRWSPRACCADDGDPGTAGDDDRWGDAVAAWSTPTIRPRRAAGKIGDRRSTTVCSTGVEDGRRRRLGWAFACPVNDEHH